MDTASRAAAWWEAGFLSRAATSQWELVQRGPTIDPGDGGEGVLPTLTFHVSLAVVPTLCVFAVAMSFALA
jgi:hypothetical protein